MLLLALEWQVAAGRWAGGATAAQRDATRTDLDWLARHAAASVACADDMIVDDLLTWLIRLRTPAGVPVAAVIDSGYFLADAVEPEAPTAAGSLRQAAARAHEDVAIR